MGTMTTEGCEMNDATIKPQVGIDIVAAYFEIHALHAYLEETSTHVMLEQLYDLRDAVDDEESK